MPYLFFARLVAASHLAYALFAAFGGLLVQRFPLIMWPHLAALVWAVGTLALDWGCPVTPWEKSLRERAGATSYEEGFVQHYILRTHYSRSGARRIHILLAIVLLLFNIFVYQRIFGLS
jgi:Protein of Unknown function (DUF2784)